MHLDNYWVHRVFLLLSLIIGTITQAINTCRAEWSRKHVNCWLTWTSRAEFYTSIHWWILFTSSSSFEMQRQFTWTIKRSLELQKQKVMLRTTPQFYKYAHHYCYFVKVALKDAILSTQMFDIFFRPKVIARIMIFRFWNASHRHYCWCFWLATDESLKQSSYKYLFSVIIIS